MHHRARFVPLVWTPQIDALGQGLAQWRSKGVDTLAVFRALAQSSNVQLIKQIPADVPAFAGDEDKLRRVQVNLVGNAIKFTPSGRQILVQAQASDDGWVLFAVRDTGEGIPAEAFDHIF